MRILLAPDSFMPRSVRSSAVFTLELARSLALRHEVRVLWGEWDAALAPDAAPTIAYGEYEGLRTVKITAPASPYLLERLCLINYAATAAFAAYLEQFKPEVVHFQGIGPVSAGAVWAARRFGAATLLTVRDYWPICHKGRLVTYAGSDCAGPNEGLECALQQCLLWSQEEYSALLATANHLPRLPAEPAQLEPPKLIPSPAKPTPGWYQLLRRVPTPVKNLVPGALRRAARSKATFGSLERPVESSDEEEPLLPVDATPGLGPWRLDFLRATFAQLHALTVTSPLVGEALRRHGFAAPKPSLLPDGPGEHCPQECKPQQEAGSVTFGYLGAVLPGRRLSHLLQAFNRLPANAHRLLIAGPGPKECASLLRGLAAHPEICFMGQLAPSQLSTFLRALDVLVLPGNESLPLPTALSYARKCRLPVIAAASPDLRAVVKDGVDGLLYEPDDVAGLEQALNRLAADAALRKELGANSPAVASAAEIAQRLEEEYHRLRPAGG